MNNAITKAHLTKYLSLTQKALTVVGQSPKDQVRLDQAEDFFDMASRYHSDAIHFMEKGDYVNAFAAVNYAHAWLDAGARLGLFKVNDTNLFAADPS